MSILNETRACIITGIKLEQKNINATSKEEFLQLLDREYTDLTDEVKTLQLVKNSLDLIAVKGGRRSYNYALRSASVTMRHLLAEATQLAAVLKNELERTQGAENERQ